MTTTSKKPTDAAFSLGSLHGYVNLGSGWRCPLEEFDLYGEAFRRAGQKLAQSLADNPAYHHLDACPIVFLYRQAIELYFKAILRSGQCLWSLEGNTLTFDESILGQHSLSPFLAPLRVFYDELGWSQSYEDCASFVAQLDEIDPISAAFRYPVDKKERSSLPDDFMFNVLEFAEGADRVLAVLYEMLHGIEHRVEEATQWLSNLEG